jgi:MraZ protein
VTVSTGAGRDAREAGWGAAFCVPPEGTGAGDRGMDRFVSNFTNRLDAKGRVSIPAPFRAVLARDGFDGLYLHPALDAPALDAGGNALLGDIDRFLSGMPLYSEERDHLSTALFGTSEILKLDSEGRVILTDSIKAHAGIADAVAFVGLGHKFQVWEPERFRAHLTAARAKVRDLRQDFVRGHRLGTVEAGA